MSNELLFAEATLGIEAQEFFASEIGRFLVGRCDQEIAEASDKLATVSTWRRNRIQQLQNQIWRAQSFKGWLAELVIAGRQAEALLERE
jgi:uncharacterized protein YdaU (DUF1376 family)